MTTIEKIINVMKDYRKFDPATITRETTFKSLDIDSLDTVDIVFKLEAAFGIEIPLEVNILVVGELVDLIESMTD